MLLFLQKFLYRGKSGCTWANPLYSGKSGCIQEKVVVFGQKWLYSGKSGYIRPRLL